MEIGARLKQLRVQHGLSQRELAKRAGVTNGTISLIERDSLSPSVSSLKKILAVFPVSLSHFFNAEATPTINSTIYRADELPDIGSGDVVLKLIGAGFPSRSLSLLHEHYPVGADTGPEMLSHPGEECGIVITGELELTVGENSWKLCTGDGYYFSSLQPHRFRNKGEIPCELISANTPAD